MTAAGSVVAVVVGSAGSPTFAVSVFLVTLAAAQIIHQDQNVRLHGRIFGGQAKLQAGIGRLEEGIERLEEGIERLEEGIADLAVRGATFERNLRSDVQIAQAEVQASFTRLHDGQHRQEEQLEEHAVSFRSLLHSFSSEIEPLRERIHHLEGRIDRSVTSLRQVSSDQTGELFSRLDSAYWHRERLYSQAEAALSLDSILAGRTGLPPLRDWALSPDSAVSLYRIAEANKPAVVVELGSGTSTVILALEAARRGSGMIIACDHSEYYAAQTLRLLDSFGVADFASVFHCPLVPTPIADGDVIDWYDLSAVDLPAAIDLLVIDGPPSHEEKRARLPAETLFDRLDKNALVVLDDSNREPEREIIERWLSRNDFVSEIAPKTEKGIAILRHTPS